MRGRTNQVIRRMLSWEHACCYSPYRMLMSEMGITRMPTNMSATAKDRRKKLVAFCNFFSSDTAIITRMFPPMVSRMMMSMSSAGQFFSLIIWLSKLWLEDEVEERLVLGSVSCRLWFRLMVVFWGQVIQPLMSTEAVVKLKPPRSGPAGAPILKRLNFYLLVTSW